MCARDDIPGSLLSLFINSRSKNISLPESEAIFIMYWYWYFIVFFLNNFFMHDFS